MVSAGKKILDCLKGSDLLLSAFLKSCDLSVVIENAGTTDNWVIVWLNVRFDSLNLTEDLVGLIGMIPEASGKKVIFVNL